MYRYSKCFIECEAKATARGLFTDMSAVCGSNASAIAVTADDGEGHKVIRLCDIEPGENAVSRAYEGAFIQAVCEILGEAVPEECYKAKMEQKKEAVQKAEPVKAPVSAVTSQQTVPAKPVPPVPEQPVSVPPAVPAQPAAAPVPVQQPQMQQMSSQAVPAPAAVPASQSMASGETGVDFLVKVGPYKAEPKMFSVIAKENPMVLVKLLRVRTPSNVDMIDYQAKANAYIAATGIQLA